MPSDLMVRLEEIVDVRKETFQNALQGRLGFDFLKIVCLAEFRKKPELMECTQESLLECMLRCAQLGLVPGGHPPQMYFVPYNNRKEINGRTVRVKEASPLTGYKGIADMVLNAGPVERIEPRAVYENEEFDIRYGTKPDIRHVPLLNPDARGKLIGAYAVAFYRSGQTQFEWMPAKEIEGIHQRSKAKDSGPWRTDREQMVLKTVVRRIGKRLPSSVFPKELMQQLADEDRRFGLEETQARESAKGLLSPGRHKFEPGKTVEAEAVAKPVAAEDAPTTAPPPVTSPPAGKRAASAGEETGDRSPDDVISDEKADELWGER